MKLIHDNIVMVEDDDDSEKVTRWMIDNTDIELRGYQNDSWLHDLKYGDIIIMNSSIPNNARFTINVNMLTKTESEQKSDKTE